MQIHRLMLVALVVCTPMQTLASILPPNNLHLEDSFLVQSNISEEEFNEIIDKAERYYSRVIRTAHGKTLKINREWDNSIVNASASQFWNEWTVNMYGGLARRPEVTPDGFALVLCHEIGHHLGGFPYSSNWAANEGQSDYFSTLSCARELWKDELDVNAAHRYQIPAGPKQLCDQVWGFEEDQNLCYRSMMAGKALADLLSALRHKTVSFKKKDIHKVRRTDHKHPAGQCRLDTFMAGALCNAQWNAKVIPAKSMIFNHNGEAAERESSQYTCTHMDDYQEGTRPSCWYASQI